LGRGDPPPPSLANQAGKHSPEKVPVFRKDKREREKKSYGDPAPSVGCDREKRGNVGKNEEFLKTHLQWVKPSQRQITGFRALGKEAAFEAGKKLDNLRKVCQGREVIKLTGFFESALGQKGEWQGDMRRKPNHSLSNGSGAGI